MSLTLYYHPLSSFSQKAVIALYENETPFTPRLVDFGDAISTAEFKRLWPIGKIPVLRDDARDRTVPEATIIIEYLAQHYPGPVELIAADRERARQIRLRDRFFDLYVQVPMQKIVGDRLRPADKKDPYGVNEARRLLATALDMVDAELKSQTWALGDDFTMADCAAAPALYYANRVQPFADTHKQAARYLERLMQRPSYARAFKEAEPYAALFPRE